MVQIAVFETVVFAIRQVFVILIHFAQNPPSLKGAPRGRMRVFLQGFGGTEEHARPVGTGYLDRTDGGVVGIVYHNAVYFAEITVTFAIKIIGGIFDRQVGDGNAVYAVHQYARITADVHFVGIGIEHAFLHFVETYFRSLPVLTAADHAVAEQAADMADFFINDDLVGNV